MNELVPRDQCEALGERLGNQHAIERIPMHSREAARTLGMMEADRQLTQPAPLDQLGPVVWDLEFPNAVLIESSQTVAALT